MTVVKSLMTMSRRRMTVVKSLMTMSKRYMLISRRRMLISKRRMLISKRHMFVNICHSIIYIAYTRLHLRQLPTYFSSVSCSTGIKFKTWEYCTGSANACLIYEGESVYARCVLLKTAKYLQLH
jgi:hypothetical protein